MHAHLQIAKGLELSLFFLCFCLASFFGSFFRLFFICLFFSFSGYFLVHTPTPPPLHPTSTSTEAKQKQVNKRKAGSEYKKFSVLDVYMISISEPPFSREVQYSSFGWFITNFNPLSCRRWKLVYNIIISRVVEMSRMDSIISKKGGKTKY